MKDEQLSLQERWEQHNEQFQELPEDMFEVYTNSRMFVEGPLVDTTVNHKSRYQPYLGNGKCFRWAFGELNKGDFVKCRVSIFSVQTMGNER